MVRLEGLVRLVELCKNESLSTRFDSFFHNFTSWSRPTRRFHYFSGWFFLLILVSFFPVIVQWQTKKWSDLKVSSDSSNSFLRNLTSQTKSSSGTISLPCHFNCFLGYFFNVFLSIFFRLCNDKRLAEEVVRLEGLVRLVELCKNESARVGSDGVLVACLAAVRKIAAAVGPEKFKNLDATELVEPRLLDSFLIFSSRNESFVWLIDYFLFWFFIF